MMEITPRVINDEVWGLNKISEPVLLDILDSQEMQRTMGISQLGPPQEYHHLKTFSRGSHIIGAMLEVRRVGGSLEEQVAACTHDLSHSACSHVIDWVVGNRELADHQDNIHANYLSQTDIPEILKKHGFDFNRIVDHEKFPILEQPIPRLCADRVDYGLREMKIGGFVSSEGVELMASSLTTIPAGGMFRFNSGRRMVFDNSEAASNFGWHFLELYQKDWGNKRALAAFQALGGTLREFLSRGVLEMSDFYRDDAYLFGKMLDSGESDLTNRLESMKGSYRDMVRANGIEGQVVRSKFRYVDPEWIENGEVFKLTEVSPSYSYAIEAERITAQKGVTF